MTVAILAVEKASVERKIAGGHLAATSFLSRWLKGALKQKRFPRELAGLLANYIDKYSKGGPHQQIKTDFYLIYNEFRTIQLKNKVFDKPDLKRLQIAFKACSALGVNVQAPLDYNPEMNGPYPHKTNWELFVLKGDYEASVKDEKLKQGLNIYIVGDRQPLIDLLYLNGIIAEVVRESFF